MIMLIMYLPPLVSLTLLSQIWNSWRSSLRVSTGSSWSVEAAVRLSPSIPERAVPMTDTLPRQIAPHPFPVSPILPSCQCCFNITPPLWFSLPLVFDRPLTPNQQLRSVPAPVSF